MLQICVWDGESRRIVAAQMGEGAVVVASPESEGISPLDSDTAHQVFFVRDDRLSAPDWPQVRTKLSQASRCFVVFGSNLTTRQIVRAGRDGAFEVVDTCDSAQRWAEAGKAAAESQSLWLSLYGGSPLDFGATLVGVSDALLALRRTIERIGPTPATVLVLGESGVGKEKVAEALHQSGSKGPFVAINCAVLPANLTETELFGVSRGAFTGANTDRPGLVEQADGGTLLLDEIGDLDLALQAKLLRFLETRKARRVGSNREYAVSVRVISATNRDLEADVAAGRFRADLFYRLAEVTLKVPPLRQRPSDIPQLARYFLANACERFGKYFDAIEPTLLVRWQTQVWPGNIRELKSTVDRLVLLHDGPVLRDGWWESPAAAKNSRVPGAGPPPVGGAGTRLPGRRERLDLARQLLAEPGHDLTWVAAQIGVHPTTLFRWRKSGRL